MTRSKSPAPTPRSSHAGSLEIVEARPPGSLHAHAKASLIPEIGREGFAALRDDIARRGLLVPLEITAKSVVLDGHLRLRAALELGLESVPVRTVAPPDEVEYLLLAAIERRQLSASQ